MSAVPSDRAARAGNDLRYEFLVESCSLAESYARSASEAAWRGDYRTLDVHLRQLRLSVIAALQTFNEIAPADGEKAEAA
jgi:hypothetical protein